MQPLQRPRDVLQVDVGGGAPLLAEGAEQLAEQRCVDDDGSADPTAPPSARQYVFRNTYATQFLRFHPCFGVNL